MAVPLCGQEKAAASRRIAPEIAFAELRQAGFTPVGDYVDANTPMAVRHDRCGRLASVCLTDIRTGTAGCKRCAMDGCSGSPPAGLRSGRDGGVHCGSLRAGRGLRRRQYPNGRRSPRVRSAWPDQLDRGTSAWGACATCGRDRTAAARRLTVEEVAARFA